MYLIPLIRTTRAITACTIIPNNPLFAIGCSEILSYVIPIINESPLYASNNIILFLFYYYYYNNSAIDLMQKIKNKNILYYNIETISIIIYLLSYFNIKH